MKQLEWRGVHELTVDGVRFHCDPGNLDGKSERDRLVLLKDRAVLDQYAAVFAAAQPRNVLEFGIFQGGSPALFSLWFELDKFVGVDIGAPVAAFDEFRRTHPVGDRISIYYATSQSDRARIENIVREEFGAAALDVVIDDASHNYKNSRRSFEIAFPLLRPGGTYVIEDWGWAHWPDVGDRYAGQTPLSVLIMEIVMACASRGDLIEEVRVFPSFAFIRKGAAARSADASLDRLYCAGGLEIAAYRKLHLGRIARLAAANAVHAARRRLARVAGPRKS
jgi:SAM-dependent methyltransferase